MDALKVQLQALLAQARHWETRIKKTTFSDSVSFTSDPETAEFTITVMWTSKAGEGKQYSKKFTKEVIFGSPNRMGKLVVQKRLCVFMQEYMTEVLHNRGV